MRLRMITAHSDTGSLFSTNISRLLVEVDCTKAWMQIMPRAAEDPFHGMRDGSPTIVAANKSTRGDGRQPTPQILISHDTYASINKQEGWASSRFHSNPDSRPADPMQKVVINV